MRALIQAVSRACLDVEAENYRAEIGPGMVILLGVRTGDRKEDAVYLADKCSALRIFQDSLGKINLSLKDISGEVLIVSQFSLYADSSRGTRPSFSDAAASEEASLLYNVFVQRFRHCLDPSRVKTGIFGAMMSLGLTNEGPMTVIVESK